MGVIFLTVVLGKIFFGFNTKAKATKANIKWEYSKLKRFHTVKETITNATCAPGENICQPHI